MPETIHMYITVILAFFLTALGAITAWLVKAVISNQERIAVIFAGRDHTNMQLIEIKSKVDEIDKEMTAGFDKLHTRISAMQGRV